MSVQGSSPEECPTLGSNVQTEYTQSSRERLFMNFGAPAQCNGTVTSWRYCSYNMYRYQQSDANGGDDDDDDDDDDSENSGCRGSASYTSIFLVYRHTGNFTYEPVPGSNKLVTLTLDCANNGGFQCRNVMLSQPEQFIIQENDIVAACLIDTRSTNPIRIVGEASSDPSTDIYQYNVNNYEDCTTSQLQSVNIQDNSVFIRNGGIYRLHLYAETSSKCTNQYTYTS